MSNSIHMTIKQVVRESGYDYGSLEFKQYVFDHNIDLIAQKGILKSEARSKRKSDKFLKENGLKH
ncbi:hypothetical protein tinsulaeT_00680 [Thalassotalea insulae]|uniref:Uncharacterized protein n=1 Tax=Thalassotalea insulae TaxID=2056778 RepID=A0ABQ6GL42_9GAMM|nr:hypothetical protein [Thalassotalea insulae]GLX76728.1 hypothetical protein tinsulaeT_00680 [Thalassotalea insulae]